MDYTLLTAVHPHRIAQVKMDAKKEQEYYERAAASQALPETVFAIINRTRQRVRAILTLAHTSHRNFGHGLIEPKAP